MQIIVITPIWKSISTNSKSTGVVNKFVEGWLNEGHQVIVLHLYTRFPRLYYLLWRPFASFLESLLGMAINPRMNLVKCEIKNSLVVLNLPVLKWFPKSVPSKRFSSRALKKVKAIDSKFNINPDIVIGHWLIPSVDLVARLKELYPNAKTCITLHVSPVKNKNYLKELESRGTLDYIDKIGYRSMWIKNELLTVIKDRIAQRLFHCPSGVNERFLMNVSIRGYSSCDQTRILFVGSLYKRKNAISILHAINTEFMKGNCEVTFIGEGEQTERLRSYSIENDLKIRLEGSLKINGIIQELDRCDVFVMISRRETFGVVYLEAMSRGRIVIGSLGEGIDGIIIDGYNGFLCEPGDANQLRNILEKIKMMSEKERFRIAKNAHITAKEFSDFQISTNYLKTIKS